MIKRIKHICSYLPLLWKDEDQDSSYLLELMIFKLNKMAKYFRKHGVHAGTEGCAKEMEFVARELRRVVLEDSESFWKKLSKHLDDTWGEIEMKFTQSVGPVSRVTISRPTEGVSAWKRKQRNWVDQELFETLRAEHYRRRDRLFRFIELNISGWWD